MGWASWVHWRHRGGESTQDDAGHPKRARTELGWPEMRHGNLSGTPFKSSRFTRKDIDSNALILSDLCIRPVYSGDAPWIVSTAPFPADPALGFLTSPVLSRPRDAQDKAPPVWPGAAAHRPEGSRHAVWP